MTLPVGLLHVLLTAGKPSSGWKISEYYYGGRRNCPGLEELSGESDGTSLLMSLEGYGFAYSKYMKPFSCSRRDLTKASALGSLIDAFLVDYSHAKPLYTLPVRI